MNSQTLDYNRLGLHRSKLWGGKHSLRIDFIGIKAITLVAFLLISGFAQAQWVLINQGGGNPHASAALEIDDTSRGLLPPRLTTTQMNNISSPASGLMIYNADSSTYYYYDGSIWTNIGTGGSSSSTVSTNWVEYTPVYTGFGTVTADTFYWRREGPDVLIRGKFTKGTGTSVEAQISLPSGLTISNDVSVSEIAGTAAWAGGATTTYYTILVDPGETHFAFGYSNNSSGALAKTDGSIIFSSSSTQAVSARIPILGWSASSGSSGSSSTPNLTQVLTEGNDAGNDTLNNVGLIGMGTNTPTSTIDIQKTTENFSISIANTKSSASDKKAVFANVTGVGNGDNYGLYGAANNNTSASDKYGVYGEAGGTSGNTYGIYGTATGSSAWAGYFNNGNVYIDNNVGIGTTTLDSVLNVNGGIMASSIRLTNGATNGHVLTSDGMGNATWAPSAGGSADTATVLADADRDTYVSTQNSSGADSDTIGLTLGGALQYEFITGGQILVPGSNASVYIGPGVGNGNGAFGNSVIGFQAFENNVSAVNNVAMGTQAMREKTSGNRNTAVGPYAMYFNTTGVGNTALGYAAGYGNSTTKLTGSNNVFLGDDAGRNMTTGSSNVLAGRGAGRNLSTGSNNVFIGSESGANETGSNLLYIENSSSATPLIWGDFANDTVRVNGFLEGTNGINITSGLANFGSTNTNPDLRMDVYRSSGNAEQRLRSGGDNDVLFRIVNSKESWAIGSSGFVKKFRISDVGRGSDRLVIDSSGFVGIGTSSPVARLDVDGDIGLDNTPTSDTSPNGITSTATVDGSTSGVVRALYIKSNGNYDLSDADATSTMPCVALAVETGTGSKKILHYGFATNSSWSWTVGGMIYVSTTTGELTQTAPSGSGDQVQVVGYATSATTLFFNPSYVVIEVSGGL
ncbi:hypothetical protein KFE98_15900 [bacterium SCSIO 12741]|nr:hypothetical protein KFE98_15900 [bacterium SCSIO 12741]